MGGVAAMVCAISFGIFMLAAVWVMFKLARTMRITNDMLDDLRKQTIPMLSRVQTTMDHINQELEYVDRIMGSAEKIASRVNSMTKLAQQLVSSPIVKIIGVGAGIQRAFGSGKEKEGKIEVEED
jgi:uncharacterized protein YoxC